MVKKRVIPCLDVAGGRVVKGVNFENLREMGEPVELARRYSELGADELVAFETWKRPERILELVRLAVAMRPGVPDGSVRDAAARLPAPDRILYFDMPPVAVSSTEVRERVARGEPIDDLVPPTVAAEIAGVGRYAGPDYTDRKTERTRDRP